MRHPARAYWPATLAGAMLTAGLLATLHGHSHPRPARVPPPAPATRAAAPAPEPSPSATAGSPTPLRDPAVALPSVSPAPDPTPTTVPEPWASLADCESGTWDADGVPIPGTRTWDATAGLHQGGLQFHPDTWDWLAPPGYPADAHMATRWQQVEVAELVLDAQGWQAWPVCSRMVGLR